RPAAGFAVPRSGRPAHVDDRRRPADRRLGVIFAILKRKHPRTIWSAGGFFDALAPYSFSSPRRPAARCSRTQARNSRTRAFSSIWPRRARNEDNSARRNPENTLLVLLTLYRPSAPSKWHVGICRSNRHTSGMPRAA